MEALQAMNQHRPIPIVEDILAHLDYVIGCDSNHVSVKC
jgi:hypothetical protein